MERWVSVIIIIGAPNVIQHQPSDLIRLIDVGNTALERFSPQGVGCRHFVALILGLQHVGEAPNHAEAISALRWRRCSYGPFENAANTHELVRVRLSEGHEVPEQRMLGAELEPHRALQLYRPRQIL